MAHPDDPTGNHLHVTAYPVNMIDRSHLALFWDLPGLRAAQVRRSEGKREFTHAWQAAYFFFRSPEPAARVAESISGNAQVMRASPCLRIKQTCSNDRIRPEYIRPDQPRSHDEGLPVPGCPRGIAWTAHVGQPIRGPFEGVFTSEDGHYRDVVEVDARTGPYEGSWHRTGVPEDFAQ